MARPIISYDDGTGSDTAASGAGPATAITGSSAATTSGASTTVSFSNTPDLSGVAADDVLWVDTTSGRKLSVIVSVNDGADTVVVEDTFDISSAVNYAIGGKRLTLQGDTGQVDWDDYKAGWIIELNDGGEFLFSSTFDPVGGTKAAGPVEVRAESGWSTRPILYATANYISPSDTNAGSGGSYKWTDIEFKNSGASDGDLFEFSGYNDQGHLFENCFFNAMGACLYVAATRWLRFVDCEFTNTGTDDNRGHLVNFSSGDLTHAAFIRCRFRDSARNAIAGHKSLGNGSFVYLEDCIFDSCGGSTYSAVVVPADNATFETWIFRRTVFYNSGNHGIEIDGTADVKSRVLVEDGIFEANGGYGISADDSDLLLNTQNRIANNAYYNNTSGQVSNVTQTDAVTMTSSPFTSASTGDFSINNTAGAGADLRGTGLEITN